MENCHLMPFIVDFPMKNGGSFHSYVSLPEGKWLKSALPHVQFDPSPKNRGSLFELLACIRRFRRYLARNMARWTPRWSPRWSPRCFDQKLGVLDGLGWSWGFLWFPSTSSTCDTTFWESIFWSRSVGFGEIIGGLNRNRTWDQWNPNGKNQRWRSSHPKNTNKTIQKYG